MGLYKASIVLLQGSYLVYIWLTKVFYYFIGLDRVYAALMQGLHRVLEVYIGLTWGFPKATVLEV